MAKFLRRPIEIPKEDGVEGGGDLDGEGEDEGKDGKE